jgi:glycerol-3-phosphate acyltransferase PlsY
MGQRFAPPEAPGENHVTPEVYAALWAVAAFVSGSVPYGLILARARGVDVRKVGSGNIGATNVGRALGRTAGAAVLVLDAAKGALPVLGALLCARVSACSAWAPSAAALGAVLGHCFTPWLRFRGGKGVATALGVFVVLDPVATAASVAVFGAVFAARRIVSLGSLAAAATYPVAALVLGREAQEIAAGVLTAAVIALRHRANWQRLRAGTEPRSGAAPPE